MMLAQRKRPKLIEDSAPSNQKSPQLRRNLYCENKSSQKITSNCYREHQEAYLVREIFPTREAIKSLISKLPSNWTKRQRHNNETYLIFSDGLLGNLYPLSPLPHSPCFSLSAFASLNRTAGSALSGDGSRCTWIFFDAATGS